MGTPLKVASYHYEHTAALFDGRVRIGGHEDAVLASAPLISDIFERMVAGDYDVAELGLTYYLRTLDLPEPPFVALPIFPNRNFRHEAVFVRDDAGISSPADLAGKRVGEFALWGHDPGVWMKGILADEHGLRVEDVDWVIGGTDHPIPPFDWIPQPVPDGVPVRHAPDGVTLASMLEDGDLDALISVDVPQAVLDDPDGTGRIRRLWPDHPRVERDYYRRTGIFPMMHAVAVRRELAGDADLLRAVYRAFLEAKELQADVYRREASKQHMGVMTPWFSHLFAENRALLGDDWWPYGVSANRTAVDTFLRYHHEQGLSRRLLTTDDVFVPELLDT